jgi:uncharacterized protein (TIGR02145 family)
MLNYRLIGLILLLSGALNAQLREFSISDMPRPEVPVVQANNQFPDDALVLVYSTIEALEFRSSLGAIDKQTYNASASRYELLVKPVKQMLFAAKAGYIEEKITTLNPNPKEVYYYKLEGKKDALPVQSDPGTLQINTTPPGADIFLNGIQIINKTPFNVVVTAGTTRIKLRKKKYAEFDTTITIESQKSTSVSHFFQSTYLYLSISSNPTGANVTLDGVVLGTTPLSREIDLSDVSKQGLKALRVQLAGYEEIEEPINYSPSNKPLELKYEMKRRKGAFLITSEPVGASVYIDGAFKGLTPYSASGEFGTYDVNVELDGFGPSEKKQLILSQNYNPQLEFILHPLTIPDEEAEIGSLRLDERLGLDDLYSYILSDRVGSKADFDKLMSTPEGIDEAFKLSSDVFGDRSDFDYFLKNGFYSVEQVIIGNQLWMGDNLTKHHFRNGDLIPEAQSTEEWQRAGENGQPAWCYYENRSENAEKYGVLYNWYAVSDPRGLCPSGWHVPSDAEWSVLIDYLGGTDVAGGKMKTTAGWQPPNTDATNESRFSGLPGGSRDGYFGTFTTFGYYGNWWSSTESSSEGAWAHGLYNSGDNAGRGNEGKQGGFSVRCVRD